MASPFLSTAHNALQLLIADGHANVAEASALATVVGVASGGSANVAITDAGRTGRGVASLIGVVEDDGADIAATAVDADDGVEVRAIERDVTLAQEIGLRRIIGVV